MKAFKELEHMIKEAMLALQSEMRKSDKIHCFSVEISSDGRVDGDIKIAYRVSADYDNAAIGNTLGDALAETMRRKGWAEAHAPVLISHITGEKVED